VRRVLLVLFTCLLAAGQTVTNSEEPNVIRSSVREVVLDVVVRHRNMTQADGLKAEEFTIKEDGVPQTVKSFRWVAGPENAAETNKSDGPQQRVGDMAGTTSRTVNFVSVVFGTLGANTRKNAMNAAHEFLRQEFQMRTYAAVFTLRDRLDVVGTFTNDKQKLADAVRVAVSASPSELANLTAGVLNQTVYNTSGGRGGITTTPAVDPSTTPDMGMSGAEANTLSESAIAIASMATSQQEMVQYVGGMRTLAGLLRMIRYEGQLPGRKTVLYLSEGLTKAPDREEMMRSVISAANQANVTFYCVDVSGMSLEVTNSASAAFTAAAAAQSAKEFDHSEAQHSMGSSSSELSDRALASNPQLAMEQLSEATGGFAVFNTNDFKKPMARIMQDIRSHYEISYVPTSSNYDGHFRSISVSVKDKKLIVQSRAGYYAVPDLNGQPVTLAELDGLHVLDRKDPPQEFSFRVEAFRFHPEVQGFEYEVVFDVATVNLKTPLSPNKKGARVHVIFLGLVKDEQGQIVGKVSNVIDREVPAEKLDDFRRGEVVVTLGTQIPPGRYVLEAAVVDPEGGRASTKRVSLVVGRSSTPVVSDLTLVRSVEPVKAPRDLGNPFEVKGARITPELLQTATRYTGKMLFFVVYPRAEPSGAAPKKATVVIQYWRNGKMISRAESALGEGDQIHSFPVLSPVKLPAGDYVAKVAVKQNGLASLESISFKVTD
jgi:VWFA-related protein